MRFDAIEFQDFFPKNTLTNANRITFEMPAFLGPSCYLPHQMMLRTSVLLSKEDGSAVPNTANVGVVNDLLHAQFESCSVFVNNTALNSHTSNYGYKAQMIDLLSFDSAAKFSFMQAQLFYQDTAGAGNDFAINSGWSQRRRRFQKKEGNNYVYTNEPIQMVGRLYTDLSSSTGPLIWGTELRVELGLASQAFMLMVVGDDKFKLTIVDAVLSVQVAQLSADLYRRIEHSLSTKPASLYFTRTQVVTRSLTKGNRSYTSEPLFPTTQLPSRVLVGLVLTEALLGDQNKNPFLFQRSWAQGEEEAGWLLGGGAGKTIFLEKAYFSLNGKSMGLEATATAYDDVVNFTRLHMYLGLTDTRTGNNQTYQDFLQGGYFLIADLTTSSSGSNLDFLVPSTRSGSLRLHLLFSDQPEQEISAVIYSEWPSRLTIDSRRRVNLSYV